MELTVFLCLMHFPLRSLSQQLCKLDLEGLLIYPSYSDVMKSIDGTLLVHSGFWAGTKISFSLDLPIDDRPASIRVTTRNIFHPLISPTDGSIAILHSTQRPQNASTLCPLVFSLHRMFYAPLAEVIGSCKHVLNEEAALLFKEDKEGFSRQLKQNLNFVTDLDSASPYRVKAVDSWTPELQTLLDKLLPSSSDAEQNNDAVSIEGTV